MAFSSDSPYHPLWIHRNQGKRDKLIGTIVLNGVEHWLTITQNTNKRKDNQPSHYYRIDPKRPESNHQTSTQGDEHGQT